MKINVDFNEDVPENNKIRINVETQIVKVM